ncbi:unnamed protein product [Aphanomyces euteiches]
MAQASFTIVDGNSAVWKVTIDSPQDDKFHVTATAEGPNGQTCELDVDGRAVERLSRGKPAAVDPLALLQEHLCMETQRDGSLRMSLTRLDDEDDDDTTDKPPSLSSSESLPSLSSDSNLTRRKSVLSQSAVQLPQLEAKASKASSGGAGWAILRKAVRRMPVFELEGAVLHHPHDLKLRMELGLRYLEQPASEVAAMILLEQASFFHDNASIGWRFWGAVGNAHFAVLKRYPPHHYCFAFHLQKCTATYSKALAYLENAADTSLIVKYATSLFMRGERDLPYELLKSLSLTYGSNGSKLEPSDVVDRLFLLFCITFANNSIHEATAHMTKLLSLATTDVSLVPKGYALRDLHLMNARCCQIQGDFLFATDTFVRLLSETYGVSTVYTDEQYLSLWHDLAVKCFAQGHMQLSIEYNTIALTYAKHLPIRAAIYFRRGLAFYCIGEPIKAEDDYRRANSTCHDAKPEVPMADLKRDYTKEFDKLLDTPASAIINQVRKGMGKTTATIKVQRHFRRFLHAKRKKTEANRMLRRLSTSRRMVAINMPGLLESLPQAAAFSTRTTPPPSLEDPFKRKRETALQALQSLHAAGSPFQKSKAAQQLESISFLSPDYDRPEHRRSRSITSYRRLGYSTGDVSCIQHWKAIIKCGQALFPSHNALRRGIAQVKSFHTGIPDGVAFCALADSDGQVDEACGKLSDASYRTEIDCICTVLDVHAWMAGAEDHDDDELDPGVPEIDPGSGKFYVHRIPNILSPPKATSPAKTAPLDVFTRLKHPIRKHKSVRMGHVIQAHSTDGLLPDKLQDMTLTM